MLVTIVLGITTVIASLKEAKYSFLLCVISTILTFITVVLLILEHDIQAILWVCSLSIWVCATTLTFKITK